MAAQTRLTPTQKRRCVVWCVNCKWTIRFALITFDSVAVVDTELTPVTGRRA